MASIILLCALPAAVTASGYAESVDLVDNFRWTQEFGDTRTLYRTPDASASCLASCAEGSDSIACDTNVEMSRTRRREAQTSNWHWVYADQGGWPRANGGSNECLRATARRTRTRASPVDVAPDTAAALGAGEVNISLAGSFGSARGPERRQQRPQHQRRDAGSSSRTPRRLSDAQLDMFREVQEVWHTNAWHSHSYKALLFPFVVLAMGAFTQHVLSRYAPACAAYTMLMLVEGFAAGLPRVAPERRRPVGGTNSMQQSLKMWADIDGHLLLYASCPLLFGDAMGLSAHMFQRTFWQCLLLAGPGVVMGAGLTGLASRAILPYGWSFSLSMTFGSILAATDPAAVAALLKAAGAWRGFIGMVAVFWMTKAAKRHSESDVIIQLSVTLVTAYLAFFLGESEVGTPGVLTTVSAALVLAWRVWPVIVSHEAMENVWHAIEYFGNTLIFALAGVLTGAAKESEIPNFKGSSLGRFPLAFG
ncbi:potassium:proton antiporter [Aureococcus anophagefferens]|uniref:Potassium:proton antiporter n=1 Tax=Aureococcus anophagefferens TaxID=44056 RepID=A0ABR1G1E1_AURAN